MSLAPKPAYMPLITSTGMDFCQKRQPYLSSVDWVTNNILTHNNICLSCQTCTNVNINHIFSILSSPYTIMGFHNLSNEYKVPSPPKPAVMCAKWCCVLPVCWFLYGMWIIFQFHVTIPLELTTKCSYFPPSTSFSSKTFDTDRVRFLPCAFVETNSWHHEVI